jgi:hypothetical protein
MSRHGLDGSYRMSRSATECEDVVVKRTQLRLAAVLVVVAAGLTACSSPSASSPGPSTSTSATAAPSPAAPDALSADVVFRITAVVTATGGESARLVETVFAPTTGDGTEPAKMSAAMCDDSGWQQLFPDPSWLHLSATATMLSGSSWPQAAPIALASSGANSWVAWTGANRTGQAYCSPPNMLIPDDSTAVIPIAAGVPADDMKSWGTWVYGFAWAREGEDVSTRPFTFTSCTLERGPGAAASPTVTAWDPTHPNTVSDDPSPECEWGSFS